LQQGQEIVFIGSHYRQREYDVITEIARAVNGEQRGTPIYVAERHITFLDGERYDFWFKNKLMTREYYYTGTVEEIYANSGYGRNVKEGDTSDLEQVIRLWRRGYSENRLFFSDNYLVIGNLVEDILAYRLESVTLESVIENCNVYTLQLSNVFDEEFEVVLIDDGNSITLTQYVAKSDMHYGKLIEFYIEYKYVPYDSVKSQRTREAVIAWCNEQIRMLSGAR